MEAVRVLGVTKSYRRGRRRISALSGLDLVVPRGSVFGLLGVNGAGKTTLLRVLTGLVRHDAGHVEILGMRIPQQRYIAAAQTGAAMDGGHLFPGFSARRNLQLVARMRRIPEKRVESALAEVGLSDRAGDLVKSYSTGMRQRLALAAALLTPPELLILDEPESGLDPIVARDIEQVIRSLAGSGTTVLLSSHQLPEVQRLCDHVGVIRKGRCVAHGSVAAVLQEGHGGVEIVVADGRTPREVLQNAGASTTVIGNAGDGLVRLHVTGVPAPADVARILALAGIYPSELVAGRSGLQNLLDGIDGQPEVQ